MLPTLPFLTRIQSADRAIRSAQEWIDAASRALSEWRANLNEADRFRPRAWGYITTDGAGAALLGNSAGIQKVAISGSVLRVYLSTPFTTLDYSVIATVRKSTATQLVAVDPTTAREYFDLRFGTDAGVATSVATNVVRVAIAVWGT